KSGDKAAIKSVQLQLMEIMVYAASHDEFKTSDIEELLQIKSSRARELIGILVRKGQIEASKGRKYRTYRSKV
ncbi:MAG: hypothetical protein Q4A75_05400, partial [Peptostreptococcaceae bacterium]|nr:hypothetical protein [Peptostreptococcaceae bacterium]